MSIFLDWDESTGFPGLYTSIAWSLMIRVLLPIFSILICFEATLEVLTQRRRRNDTRRAALRAAVASGGSPLTAGGSNVNPPHDTITVAEVTSTLRRCLHDSPMR